MRPELTSYLLVAGAGFIVTVATVPLFLLLSNRLGLLVAPDSRRQHERPTSALGGGAMFLGFVAAFVVAWQSGRFDAVFDKSTEPWGVLACATVAYLVGALDDVIELSPPAKLAGTIVASLGIGGLNKLLEPSFGAVYGKVLILVLVILFLQWRPSGLFAVKGRHADA